MFDERIVNEGSLCVVRGKSRVTSASRSCCGGRESRSEVERVTGAGGSGKWALAKLEGEKAFHPMTMRKSEEEGSRMSSSGQERECASEH
jgi:hypothetical protein